MEAALTLTPPSLSFPPSSKTMVKPWKSTPRFQITRFSAIRTTAAVAYDSSTVDYSAMTSVFPAEACETLGGEACNMEMFPEVKIKPEAPSSKNGSVSELYEREYLEYNSSKTVFLDEACDDLGGEFCKSEYK